MSKTGRVWSRRDYLKMSVGAVIVIAINYAISPILNGSFLVSVVIFLLILYVIPVILLRWFFGTLASDGLHGSIGNFVVAFLSVNLARLNRYLPDSSSQGVIRLIASTTILAEMIPVNDSAWFFVSDMPSMLKPLDFMIRLGKVELKTEEPHQHTRFPCVESISCY